MSIIALSSSPQTFTVAERRCRRGICASANSQGPTTAAHVRSLLLGPLGSPALHGHHRTRHPISIQGVILKRTLSRLPKKRFWFVGFSRADGVQVADNLNEDWSTDLIVGKHGHHYTGGLVRSLTGDQSVLDLLRATSRKEFIL